MKTFYLLLISLVCSTSAIAQKKPVKFVPPVPVAEDTVEEPAGTVILMAPLSPNGSFSFNRKNLSTGKISKVNVQFHIYGKDTNDYWFWNDLTLELNSSQVVPYKLVITGYNNPNRIYTAPLTTKGNRYHLDITALEEKPYKLVIYDDRGNWVHELAWQKQVPNVGTGDADR